MKVLVWLALGILGGAGAVLRFHVDRVVQLRARGDFAVGTLVVNVTGSFVLGALRGAGVAGDALLLSGTGGLGSFTTFSTWVLETQRLGEEGDEGVAAANLVIPVVAGLAAAAAGWAVGAAL